MTDSAKVIAKEAAAIIPAVAIKAGCTIYAAQSRIIGQTRRAAAVSMQVLRAVAFCLRLGVTA